MLSGKQFSVDDFRARFDNRNADVCGIHVVGKGSWKEGEVGKFWVGKFELKLERMKLESSSVRALESTTEVWKWLLKLWNFQVN